jgi:hypothetical protein
MAVKSLIQTVTVGAGGAASIEFTNIPQDGSDLVVTLSGRNTATSRNAANYISFNADTDSTTQSGIILIGYGNVTQTVSFSYSIRSASAGATANTFGSAEAYISNYSGATNKSFSVDSVGENNATQSDQAIHAGLWPYTAAITALKVGSVSGNFVQYSTASLFKIKYD